MSKGVYTTVDNVNWTLYYPDWPEDFTGMAMEKGWPYIAKDGAIVKSFGNWWPKELYLSQEALWVLRRMDGFLEAEEVLRYISQKCGWCGRWQHRWEPECQKCGAPMPHPRKGGFVGRFECTDLYLT